MDSTSCKLELKGFILNYLSNQLNTYKRVTRSYTTKKLPYTIKLLLTTLINFILYNIFDLYVLVFLGHSILNLKCQSFVFVLKDLQVKTIKNVVLGENQRCCNSNDVDLGFKNSKRYLFFLL